MYLHEAVMTWKCFSHFWSFVQENHWSSVDSLHNGPVCGALMRSLMLTWISCWTNSCIACYLRCEWYSCDVTVMYTLYRPVITLSVFYKIFTTSLKYWMSFVVVHEYTDLWYIFSSLLYCFGILCNAELYFSDAVHYFWHEVWKEQSLNMFWWYLI